MSKSASRKVSRKQNKLSNMLVRELKIDTSSEPTKILFIGNAGLVTGLQRETILTACLKYGAVEDIVMMPGKSYCFVVYRDIDSSHAAFDSLNASSIHGYPDALYLTFAKSTPIIEKIDWNKKPPGAVVHLDFISELEETSLLNCISWESENSEHLKHRRVKHYGYEFQYHNNNINKEEPLKENIPSECNFLFDRLREMGNTITNPDQLTVNQYLPGQGIPPHIDTHSACGDTILSLSLGSAVVMDFKKSSRESIPVVLPQRSLLIMSDEARYAWTHGITPRKKDIVPASDGDLTVQKRGIRTSLTFRWTRRSECNCIYHSECDSFKKHSADANIPTDHMAAELESNHVHKVYEDIANHFSETRHKPWPNVLNFVQDLPSGSLLVDVGCGNGKYFGHKGNILEVGCDTSWNLLKVCRERGFQAFLCNCLAIPLRDSTADACISIAVIHHLATEKRRLRALSEMERVLKPGGKALVYVWAKNQARDNEKSAYLKQSRKNRKSASSEEVPDAESGSNITECANEKKDGNPLRLESNEDRENDSVTSANDLPNLPIHTNRTQFAHQDILVPWKLKPQSQKTHTDCEVPTFYRYYHVFEEGELEGMCSGLTNSEIIKSYYDQGNWCVIFQKRNER